MKKNRFKKERNYRSILRIGGGIFVLILVSFGCVISYVYLCQLPYFAIKRVVVVGNEQVPQTKIVKFVLDCMGAKSLLAVNSQKIKHLLLEDPLIKEVKINRIWPDELKITIKERHIVALAYFQNHWWWVEETGKCLLAGKRYFDLPIITGIKTPDDPQLNSVIRLLRLLQKEKGVLSLKNISEVHLDEDLGLTLFTLNGQEILLGKNAFSDKLKTLRKVFVYLQKKHLSVKRIDLTEPNRVYAKLAH
jgi:cell division protein FtsQ